MDCPQPPGELALGLQVGKREGVSAELRGQQESWDSGKRSEGSNLSAKEGSLRRGPTQGPSASHPGGGRAPDGLCARG